jgi:iron complex outermembrane receptor protein
VDHAFSPNAGVVYRPAEPLSFYFNWSESFQQQNGIPVNIDGEVLEPEEATLYETGTKWSLFDGRLGGTLAFYKIFKDNARNADQDNPGFQKAVGEVESQGIELDISGQITPGWQVITAYAYNDSEITFNTDPSLIGNRPMEIPRHSARLWSTYEFQAASLKGFGFGGGLTYVGEREANDANEFELPGYTTVAASIFYDTSDLTARLNFKNLLNNDDIVANTARGTFVKPGAPFHVLASLEYKF